MPANLFALAAGVVASVAMGDWMPLAAVGSASGLYLALVSGMPSFRRAVRAQAAQLEEAPPDETELLMADLAPSQRQHYQELDALKTQILAAYRKMPGGRVLAANSERQLNGLLASFLRLVGTLNAYRRFLSSGERAVVEKELAELEREAAGEANAHLRDVKARRIDILKKRLQRFVQAEESRELVSHQLAGIEDVLRLTHEQSISIRDPELVSQQLDALTSEVTATEETVRELEQFMQVTETLSSTASLPGGMERVR